MSSLVVSGFLDDGISLVRMILSCTNDTLGEGTCLIQLHSPFRNSPNDPDLKKMLRQNDLRRYHTAFESASTS